MEESIAIPPALTDLLVPETRVVIFSGAGMSAESGIATFRDPDGLWSRFRPEELASIQAFMRNPARVWEFYAYRREVLASAAPNPGHLEVARWQDVFEDLTVVTQNVDGLHQAAGSQNVLELHGNIRRTRCFDNGHMFEGELRSFGGDELPRCKCGSLLRPDVVWFGEMLPAETVDAAWQKTEACELFVSVGTSSIVQPAASLIDVARGVGAYTVEVNPAPTEKTGAFDLVVSAPSGQALPAIGAHLPATRTEAGR